MDLSKPIISQVVHNRTRAECTKAAFSGVRRDEIGGCFEVWLIGSVAATVTDMQIKMDPDAMAKAYEEVFMLEPGSLVR